MRIVILDGGVLNPGDVSWKPLEALGELTVYDHTPPEEFASRASGADIVLVNKTPVKERNIPALGQCKLLGALATGVNNIDIEALGKAGIAVCNVRAYGSEDVAQHALALLLELTRSTALHTQSVIAGEWTNKGAWCYWTKTPRSLCGLTMGIIGFGSIGQTLGKYASALGMNILAWSRSHKASADYPFKWAELEDIWKKSDIISLHCPLTSQTREIINKNTIKEMKDGVIIINTARGPLVNEKDAAEALVSGKISGLGTDVLSVEPPMPDNPLLYAPNTLITPHIAWATTRARQNIIDLMAKNIQNFMNGQPENIINMDYLNV